MSVNTSPTINISFKWLLIRLQLFIIIYETAFKAIYTYIMLIGLNNLQNYLNTASKNVAI